MLLDQHGPHHACTLALKGWGKLLTDFQERLLLHIKVLDPCPQDGVIPPICASGPAPEAPVDTREAAAKPTGMSSISWFGAGTELARQYPPPRHALAVQKPAAEMSTSISQMLHLCPENRAESMRQKSFSTRVDPSWLCLQEAYGYKMAQLDVFVGYNHPKCFQSIAPEQTVLP